MKNIICILMLAFISCNNMRTESSIEKYIPLLKKLHELECDNLKKFGTETVFTDSYAFRSAAFQAVLKNPDRKVLAEYEEYYQQLAHIEFHLNAVERGKYFEDVRQEYALPCE